MEFKRTGANTIYTKEGLLIWIGAVFVLGILSSLNFVLPIAFLVFFGLFYYINQVRLAPGLAIKTLFLCACFISGITRILPLPLGLSIDGLLLLTWLVLFFTGFEGANWKLKNNSLTLCLGLWMLFCVLQLLNPQVRSYLAWFYAVRSLAMNGGLLAPLLFLAFNKKKDLSFFINFWFLVSIFMGIYGAKQYFIGVFAFEQHWLNGEGGITHVLFGRFTRMFSFMSDANAFGCFQAYTALVATIMLFGERNWKKIIFYSITAGISFFGMFISGTRTAIIIPVVGFAVFMVLSKNYKLLALGSIVGGVMFYILAYTFILHSVEPIRRMRTAFNPTEDESFQVRLENRRALEVYLADKPFGGGIGSAGVWGKRFSPGNFLANFETDGHYTRIKAETGFVGLTIYLTLYGFILLKMCLICFKLKDPVIKYTMIGFTSAVFGCMAANYTNPVILGLPLSIIVVINMAFVYMSQKWNMGEEYPDFLILKNKNE